MKNITFALITLLLATIVTKAQGPEFVKNLGNGVYSKIECACAHSSNGNLSIGFFNLNKDSLIIKTWKAASNNWEVVQSIATGNISGNQPHCVYKKDSIIVSTKFKVGVFVRSGIFYVEKGTSDTLGELKYGTGEGTITDLKNIKGKLAVFGQFDAITWQKNNLDVENASVFDGDKWIHIGLTLEPNDLSELPVANINDTTLIISKKNEVFQAVVKQVDQWDWSRLPISETTKDYNSITALGNRWILTKENNDTLVYFDGKTKFKHRANSKLSGPLTILNTVKGILVSENGPSGRLMKLESDSVISPLYLSFRLDTTHSVALLESGGFIYYISSSPIVYKNINYGNAVSLDMSKEKLVDLDTISIFVFDDENKNFVKDLSEPLIPSTLFNKTYGRQLKSTSGFFQDLVPGFNDVDYDIISIDTTGCFKLPFTGLLRSVNTRDNISKDELYFPLQRVDNRNLIVKGSAKAKARLMDTIPLTVNIFNRDCDNKNSDVLLRVTLDPNTVFINSNIAYTSKQDNVLIYDLKNLSPQSPNSITLNVVYPVDKFVIEQSVKHFVSITTDFVEDPSGNKDSIVQKMSYSFDPNAKYCYPEGNIKSDVRTIRYYIEFQNEGTDEAIRVTVIDTLQVNIPVYEFQLISCSHPYTVSLSKNVVTWVFENINLPPKSLSDAGSKGFIIFEAHLNKSLGIGDSVKNKAFIYFDYNKPIPTNTAVIIRDKSDTTSTDEDVIGKNSIVVFPNPVTHNVNIRNKSFGAQDVKVYNMIGQQVLYLYLNPSETIVQPMDSWPRGMYFIRSSKGGFRKFLVQ